MILTSADSARSSFHVNTILVLLALARQVSLLFANKACRKWQYHLGIIHLRLLVKERLFRKRQFGTGFEWMIARSTFVANNLGTESTAVSRLLIVGATHVVVIIGRGTFANGVARFTTFEANHVFVLELVSFVSRASGVFGSALFFGNLFPRGFGYLRHGDRSLCLYCRCVGGVDVYQVLGLLLVWTQ